MIVRTQALIVHSDPNVNSFINRIKIPVVLWRTVLITITSGGKYVVKNILAELRG